MWRCRCMCGAEVVMFGGNLQCKSEAPLRRCRHTPRVEQPKPPSSGRRGRRSHKPITLDGEIRGVKEWCRKIGIQYLTYRDRVARGMTPEQALRLGKQRRAKGQFPPLA